jgi:hypothetical protein
LREVRVWPTAAAVIDSQTVRAADTVPTASSGYDGGKKIKGRKRHVAVDTGGLLLAVVVTTASLQDRDGAFRITAALREAFSTITLVWADAGSAGRFVIEPGQRHFLTDKEAADLAAQQEHDPRHD